MNLFYFLLALIVCENSYSIKEGEFSFVFDSEIKKLAIINKENGMYPHGINLKMSEEMIIDLHYWDKHFPKPFMYLIDFYQFKKSKVTDTITVEYLSPKDKALFRFKIDFGLEDVTISNFYDSNNKKPMVVTKDDSFKFNTFIITAEDKEQ